MTGRVKVGWHVPADEWNSFTDYDSMGGQHLLFSGQSDLPDPQPLSKGVVLVLTAMSNKTTVNKTSNGQYRTTVPKAIAEARELDGKKLAWFTTTDGFRIEILDLESKEGQR